MLIAAMGYDHAVRNVPTLGSSARRATSSVDAPSPEAIQSPSRTVYVGWRLKLGS